MSSNPLTAHRSIDLALCVYVKGLRSNRRCDVSVLARIMEDYAFLCIYASRRNALNSADSGDAGAQKEAICTPGLVSAGSHYPGHGGSLGKVVRLPGAWPCGAVAVSRFHGRWAGIGWMRGPRPATATVRS